ncbi:hypothetical protein Tcan_12892 [Toxocara canis]|uniref:Uncharacterized protein n=1 Tax=Toxocara canis TaxID=6265 RepID=A0A0B2W6S7_TOXCA|nr:hypothetical protein Tcan_12892 [Toxocara canis]
MVNTVQVKRVLVSLFVVMCTLYCYTSANPLIDASLRQPYALSFAQSGNRQLVNSRYDRNCFFSPMNCVFYEHPMDVPVRRFVLGGELFQR